MSRRLSWIAAALVVGYTPLGAIGQNGYESYCRFLGDYPSQLEDVYTHELQGIAHDDTHWYLIQVDAVWRVPRTMDLNDVNVFDPGVSIRDSDNLGPVSGVNHLGDGEVFHDTASGLAYLVVPIEGPTGLLFLRADSSLAYVKHVLWQDVNSVQDHSSWAAVDPQGRIYSSNFDNVDRVYRYSMNWASLEQSGDVDIQPAGELPLQSIADEVQGGVFSPSGERLYLVADAIRAYNADTGALLEQSANGSGLFNFQYNPDVPVVQEPEGVTYWDLDSAAVPGIHGQLHVILLDNDPCCDCPIPDCDDIYIKHYTHRIWVDLNALPFLNDGTLLFPYLTVTEAANLAWNGSEIRVRAGSYSESLTISARTRLVADNGLVRIGTP